MKRTLLTGLIFSVLSFPALAAETYTLDPYHTNLFWHADHLGFSTPSGKFADVEGTVTLDEEKPENSKVSVRVNMTSILTGIEKFDTHLKSKDFFNVDKFPSTTFTSTKVEPSGKDNAKVTGDLTLLGITKPVTLDVKLNKIGIFPMNNKKTAGFSATGVIRRSEFGMSYGVPGVGDDVKLTIEAEATLKEESKEAQ